MWKLYVDGGARGNPGPAAAGIVLINPQGQIIIKKGLYLGETTNNVAEYQALLLGLAEAHRLEVKKLLVLADSELMVKQMTGHYKVKSLHLLPLRRQALDLSNNFESFEILHIARDKNKMADKEVNIVINLNS